MEIRPFRCDLIHWQTEVAHRKLQSSSISFQASEKYSSKIVTWHRIDIDQKKERERMRVIWTVTLEHSLLIILDFGHC